MSLQIHTEEIKNLKEHNEFIQAENEKLREEIKKLKTDLIKVPKHSMNYRYMGEMEEEIKKLKAEKIDLQKEVSRHRLALGNLDEEIKKLKEELLHEQQKGTSIDTEEMDKLVNIFDEKIASCDIAEEVKKLKAHNEELKKDNEDKKTTIDCLNLELDYLDYDETDMSDFNTFIHQRCSKEDYMKFYDWFAMDEYDVKFIDEDSDEEEEP